MNIKEEPVSQTAAIVQTEAQAGPSAPTVANTAPTPPDEPSLRPADPVLNPGLALSPGTKRRQSERTVSSTSSIVLAPKRVKPDNPDVKILPLQYELCDVEDIVILMASMISELCEQNDKFPLNSGALTRFHSR